jgi:hypothetical protein
MIRQQNGFPASMVHLYSVYQYSVASTSVPAISAVLLKSFCPPIVLSLIFERNRLIVHT